MKPRKSEALIEEPIDYDQLARAYDACGWRWTTHNPQRPSELEVPKADRIRRVVQELTAGAIRGGYLSSGGITAMHDTTDTVIYIHKDLASHYRGKRDEQDAIDTPTTT